MCASLVCEACWHSNCTVQQLNIVELLPHLMLDDNHTLVIDLHSPQPANSPSEKLGLALITLVSFNLTTLNRITHNMTPNRTTYWPIRSPSASSCAQCSENPRGNTRLALFSRGGGSHFAGFCCCWWFVPLLPRWWLVPLPCFGWLSVLAAPSDFLTRPKGSSSSLV
jgi:hypothetical protein